MMNWAKTVVARWNERKHSRNIQGLKSEKLGNWMNVETEGEKRSRMIPVSGLEGGMDGTTMMIWMQEDQV